MPQTCRSPLAVRPSWAAQAGQVTGLCVEGGVSYQSIKTINFGWTRPMVESAGQKRRPVRNGVVNRSGFLGNQHAGRQLDDRSSRSVSD